MTLSDFQNPIKIFTHLDRVLELRNLGDTTPIHITIGLVNYCNHNCRWCYIEWCQAGKNSHHNPISIERVRLIKTLAEAKNMGLKAVTIVGDGEPTLHPEFINTIEDIRKLNLDLGIFTNMSVKNELALNAMINNCFFIRCSVDAANAKTHEITHGSKDFKIVVANISRLVKRRSGNKFPIVGVQFAVNELNIQQINEAANFFKKLGVDYISYKPVYKNALNRNHEKNQISYDVVYEHLKLAKEMETDEFKVYPKLEQFKEVLENVHNEGRLYQKCYATALSIYLDEDGGMELCGNLKGRGYTIGNIYKNSFRELWQSERRKLFINKVNLNKCPAGCRLNPLNIVLWNALHPDVRRIHPNFV